MPVAGSTASGNLAGWAVARHDHRAVARRRRSAPGGAEADRGVRVDEHAGARRGRSADDRQRGSSSSRPARRRSGRSLRRLDRRRAPEPGACSSACAAPSRPSSSNSSRSRFDDTWMSIDGLSVGTTSLGRPSCRSVEEAGEDVVAVRADDELVDRQRPSARATQPAKTLPKLPVGTRTRPARAGAEPARRAVT